MKKSSAWWRCLLYNFNESNQLIFTFQWKTLFALTTLAETLASNHSVEGFHEAGTQFGKSFHYKEPSGKVFSLTSDVVK